MAPQVQRRKRRTITRLVRGALSLVFLGGLAGLIYRPLLQLSSATYNRLQLGGTSRLFGGAASPTVTQWLAFQQQQTGALNQTAGSYSACRVMHFLHRT